MQNALWKLAALASVVGIGLLVVFQAQKGLKRDAQDETAIQAELGEFEGEDPNAPAAATPNNARTRLTADDGDDPFGANSNQTAPRSTAPPAADPNLFAEDDSGNEVVDFSGGNDTEEFAPEPRTAPRTRPDNPFMTDDEEPLATTPRGATPRGPAPRGPAGAAARPNVAAFEEEDANPFEAETAAPTRPRGAAAEAFAPEEDPADLAAPASRTRNAPANAAMEEDDPFGGHARGTAPRNALPADDPAEEVNFESEQPFATEAGRPEIADDDAFPGGAAGSTATAPRAATPRSRRPQPSAFDEEPGSAPVRETVPAHDAVPAFAEDLPEDDDFQPDRAVPVTQPRTAAPRSAQPRGARPRNGLSDDEGIARPETLPRQPPTVDLGEDADDFPASGARSPANSFVDETEEEIARPGNPSYSPTLPDDADSFPTTPRTAPRNSRNEADETIRSVPSSEPRGIPRPQQRPQLTIEKAAPPNAILGQPLIYKVVVRNVGSSPAQQVIVEDEIPQGTKLTGTIPRAELTGNRLIWRMGTINAGEERTIQVRVIPHTEGEIGSIATVNFVSEVAAQTRITAPKLRLEMSAPPRARVGDEVILRFQISNMGSGDATGVVVRDVLPNSLNHPGGNDLEYTVGLLPAGKVKSVDLTLTAAKAGRFLNRATLSADGGVTEVAEVEIDISGPSVSVQRSGPERQFLNRTAVYTNTVTNDGQQPSAPLTIVERIPAGFEFDTADQNGRYDPQRRTVTWELGRIEPGRQTDLKVSLLATGSGEKTTAVRIYEGSRALADAQFETSVSGFPAIALELSQLSDPIAVGEQIVYQVRVVNRGTDSAADIHLAIGVPPELELRDLEGPVTGKRGQGTIDFDTIQQLGPKESATFRLTLNAVAEGDARLQFQIEADHLQKPLAREESVFVVPAGR